MGTCGPSTLPQREWKDRNNLTTDTQDLQLTEHFSSNRKSSRVKSIDRLKVLKQITELPEGMPVNNPLLQRKREEWKREMKKSQENWRRERTNWVSVDARDGEKDDEEGKSEDFGRRLDNGREEEQENEGGGKTDEDDLDAENNYVEEEKEKSDHEGGLYEEKGKEKQETRMNKSEDRREEDLKDDVAEERLEEEHQFHLENIQPCKEQREQEKIGSDKEVSLSGSVESLNSEDVETRSTSDHEDLEDGRLQAWKTLDQTKSAANEQEFPKMLQEESSDDEKTQSQTDEGEDTDDVDEFKVYYKDDHPTYLFSTLTKFRESFILTDLTLKTVDGRSFHVHAPVLAAVSSTIWIHLKKQGEENRQNGSVGLQQWSVCLGPEVDAVGLEAIVEFAYTGFISFVTRHNVKRIRAVAKSLGAPRVWEFCDKDEDSLSKQNEDDQMFAAEQMKFSLQFIKQQWTDRVGCDVLLEALGGSLHVHRVILAVSSDYFHGMFTLNMKESRQSCVSLPFLSVSELEVLVGSSYSGTLPLSWTSIFELTSRALQLQHQPALSLCLTFLQQEITPHTCLDVVSFAEAFEMPHLLEAAEEFILQHFQKVACTSKFSDLPARQLLKYLSSKSLCVSSELTVFNAAVSWITAKPNIRLKLARELVKMVHFPLMTFTEFKEVQSQTLWCDASLAGLFGTVLEDFCSSETALPNRCRSYSPKECLVLIGGDQISEDLCSRSVSRELWFGNSLRNLTGIKKTMEWRKLGELPESERFSHEVAVLNGQLYVFGGKKYYGIGDTLNSVFRFDPNQNSWEGLSEMQEKRSCFSVVVLEGKIYAIGGLREPDHLDSVEYYCPTTNTWSFSWPLDLSLSGHTAKVFKEQVFVSGGQNNDGSCLSYMFVYHPETGSTFLANMSNPRAHHCMETLGEGLYVAGGITANDNVTLINQLACEVYSPAANSWTAFASLSVPHVGAGSVVLEGRLYLLGGYSQEDYSDTKMVHRFDPAMQKWENIGKTPGPNNDLGACLLTLPQHLRT